ncbi:hypothetical protein RN001_009066 [Aquatica leii]|uniref:Uncharacterized protein n=1 Tax=Aquatica leii TaxID=1421715 RepID=A0AAN7Q254_9COLE|nr:hypothetical protein RN001_009066 [Aquatica leii]
MRIECDTKYYNNQQTQLFPDSPTRTLQPQTQISDSNEDIDNISILVQPDLDNQTVLDLPEIIIEQNQNNNLIDDDQTIHSNAGSYPYFEIPIISTAVNYGQNQIIINSVLHSPANPKTMILFEKRKRISLQLSQNNLEKDVIDFIKNDINPNTQYHLYFEDPDLYEPFSAIIQKYFTNSSLKFKRCTKKLIDVNNKNDLKEII